LIENSGWVSVRCPFLNEVDGEKNYEERITLWRTHDLDLAIARAEAEAEEYAEAIDVEYLGLAQAYLLYDAPGEGAEIFSLIRSSDLSPASYINTHFDTGAERQQHRSARQLRVAQLVSNSA